MIVLGSVFDFNVSAGVLFSIDALLFLICPTFLLISSIVFGFSSVEKPKCAALISGCSAFLVYSTGVQDTVTTCSANLKPQ